ncbi:MAG: hypothetical protein AB7H93_18595 [Vicinamibacterales bacterium]
MATLPTLFAFAPPLTVAMSDGPAFTSMALLAVVAAAASVVMRCRQAAVPRSRPASTRARS